MGGGGDGTMPSQTSPYHDPKIRELIDEFRKCTTYDFTDPGLVADSMFFQKLLQDAEKAKRLDEEICLFESGFSVLEGFISDIDGARHTVSELLKRIRDGAEK